MLYARQLDVFQFLEGVSPLIQKASSVLTNWRGVAGFQTLCGSVLKEALRTPMTGFYGKLELNTWLFSFKMNSRRKCEYCPTLNLPISYIIAVFEDLCF